MSNMATPYFRDGRSYPTKAQINEAVDAFDRFAAKGLVLDDIAEELGVTRGSICVIRRWSLERASGREPAIEVRL